MLTEITLAQTTVPRAPSLPRPRPAHQNRLCLIHVCWIQAARSVLKQQETRTSAMAIGLEQRTSMSITMLTPFQQRLERVPRLTKYIGGKFKMPLGASPKV